MKSLLKKTGCCLLVLVFIAGISYAALDESVINDSIPQRKPMLDVTAAVDTAYQSLSKTFGRNKQLPAGYEKQILYALSFFPELADTKIDFQIKKSSAGIISTRPLISSLLKRSSRRSYVVVINDSIAGRAMPTWLHCETNGQVGILGHELCHIIYFSKQSGLGLMGLGVAHISKRYIDRFENKTDSMDIERGLGYQLIAWNEYLHTKFRAMRLESFPSFVKSPGRERYMTIEHIRRLIAGNKLYNPDKIE